jgi:UrcA family protein
MIGLSVAALALPSLASADDMSGRSITAVGHVQQHGWLTTSGPDASGRYRVSVGIADLDLATEAGRSTMAARAERGGMVLCEISAEEPQVKGYHNSGERRCRQEASDLAQQQIAAAREAMQQGRSVKTLGMATSR